MDGNTLLRGGAFPLTCTALVGLSCVDCGECARGAESDEISTDNLYLPLACLLAQIISKLEFISNCENNIHCEF